MCCGDLHTQNLRKIKQKHHIYDVYLNHFAPWNRPPRKRTVEQTLKEIRRLVPEASFVSSTREPISHFISWYNYFIDGTRRGKKEYDSSLAKFVSSGDVANPLASELGLRTRRQIRDAFQTTFRDVTWILQDRYVESLVAMRRRFNWDLSDVLFAKKIFASNAKSELKRWDGKYVAPTRSIETIEPQLLSDIERATELDRYVHELSTLAFERTVSTWTNTKADADHFLAECDALRRANELVRAICDGSTPHPSCVWFAWGDMQYESHLEDIWPGDLWEY